MGNGQEGEWRKRTYGTGVARKVVHFLELREDDDGLSFRLEPFPELMIANEGGGERAAKTAGDEELRDGLDGVLGRLVQLCGLLAAAKSERGVVDCRDQLEDEFSLAL